MDGCMTALAHAAAGIIVPGAQTDYYEEPAGRVEVKRFKTMRAEPPRSSLVKSFSSGVVRIANRVIVWVTQAARGVERKISAFQYQRACDEAMLALEMAVRSKSPDFIKAQMMHLIACRERQKTYLLSLDKTAANHLDNKFYERMNTLIKGNRKTLQEHQKRMYSNSSAFKSFFTDLTRRGRREFHEADKLIGILLKESAEDSKQKANALRTRKCPPN